MGIFHFCARRNASNGASNDPVGAAALGVPYGHKIYLIFFNGRLFPCSSTT
jgi:hypothetical protein